LRFRAPLHLVSMGMADASLSAAMALIPSVRRPPSAAPTRSRQQAGARCARCRPPRSEDNPLKDFPMKHVLMMVAVSSAPWRVPLPQPRRQGTSRASATSKHPLVGNTASGAVNRKRTHGSVRGIAVASGNTGMVCMCMKGDSLPARRQQARLRFNRTANRVPSMAHHAGDFEPEVRRVSGPLTFKRLRSALAVLLT
jgi:hypothetical protein